MKKNLMAGLILLASSGAAYARCWDECVLWNPISGNCVKYVKVCDVENPGTAAASLTVDIEGAASRITSHWHDLWGQVPPGLRVALERHPLTILSVVFPETRAYALVIGAIEEYVMRVTTRADDSKRIVDNSPIGTAEWKQRILEKGEEVLIMADGDEVGATDYASQKTPNFAKFDQPWRNFTTCMENAWDMPAGNACLTTLKREVFTL